MNRIMGLLVLAALLIAAPLGEALARGFGGFRSGGGSESFRGGGFGGPRGGEFESFRGGDWARDRGTMGGFRADSIPRFRSGEGGGFRGDRDGGFRRGEPGPVDPRARGMSDLPGRDFAGASRTQLNKFLGLPTDAGVGHAAGFTGTHVTAGRIEGPHGGSAGFVSGTHVRYVPPEVRSARGWSVRNSFNRYNLFRPDWWRRHPGAWIAAGVAASAWATATWDGVSDWVGCDPLPEDYDYGSTVLYQGDNVYIEGQPVGSAAQYYDQASSLAISGDAAQDDQSQWMSLGVFGMVQGDQTDPTMVFQLAVNRQGVVRGNCYNTMTDTSLPVQGALDKKTQRVAWTIGDNKDTVFDTGLYNLTQDQAPALVHFGKDRTQEWLMVRMQSQAEVKND